MGACCALFLSFWLLNASRGKRARPSTSPPDFADDKQLFLLKDGILIAANFPARRQLASIPDTQNDEARLWRLLSTRFDDVRHLLAPAVPNSDMRTTSRDGQLQIIREVADKQVRLEIASRQVADPNERDIHILDANAEELRLLRENVRVAPFLLWRQNKSGDVVWANKSYVDAAKDAFGVKRLAEWPLPSLFGGAVSGISGGKGTLRRTQMTQSTDENAPWFDCHVSDFDGGYLCTAFPADEAVRSEKRRREFTQTLTKTFSDLAIGLAIFDSTRRLVLFNPALTDLTSLPGEFLTNRPSLTDFLDQLREKRVMPEPRDYHSWRKSIADLESASMKGTYSETWSLPDGQTYRISGQPHPDGALALLIEDISAEMSLTRRFRAQIDQSQSVIDSLDDAIALFSSTGELLFSNTAYKLLWDDPSEDSVLGTTVTEATRAWHKHSVPTPVWGDFRDFAFLGRERDEWTAQVGLRDGRQVHCRFVPQKSGASLVVFHIQRNTRHISEDLRQAV